MRSEVHRERQAVGKFYSVQIPRRYCWEGRPPKIQSFRRPHPVSGSSRELRIRSMCTVLVLLKWIYLGVEESVKFRSSVFLIFQVLSLVPLIYAEWFLRNIYKKYAFSCACLLICIITGHPDLWGAWDSKGTWHSTRVCVLLGKRRHGRFCCAFEI